MNKARLKHLIKILSRVPEEKFNLRDWGHADSESENVCGTSACAVGHACFDPKFRKQGLTYELGQFNRIYPVFEDRVAWLAVWRFFDLNSAEAHWLFDHNAYAIRATPKMVIDRIKHLVENGTIKGDKS